jgi:hypothetical protein
MDGGWLAANWVKGGVWFWSGLLGKHLHGASFFVLLFFCLVSFSVSIFFCFTLFSFV